MRRRRKVNLDLLVNPAEAKLYLARDLDSHDWLKTVPRAELEQHIKALGHRFATDCWHNQLVCFAIGAALKEFLFFLKMGGGKSKITLDLIRYRKRRGELGRALILAPELLHVASWEDQIKKHAPDLSYRLLLGDRDERASLVAKPSDICVMNYKGLESYMAHRIKNKKGKGEQVVNKTAASEFAALFNFVAMDESHRLGNFNSLVFNLCFWLSAAADFRYALTGTPFGRDPTLLWSQFALVDRGETLGRTVGAFRNVFFRPKKDYWSGVQWEYRRGMGTSLNRVIKNRSITYELRELRDMPKKVLIRLPVRLTGEGAAYYRRIRQGLREAQGDYRSLDSAFIRMRQCCSGFIAMRADDESRIELRFNVNPKLDALREFVLSKQDKIMVFHDFIPSGLIIEKMLDEIKVPYASLRGAISMGKKDPISEYRRFLDDPKCQIFVLNNQSGSESINPQYVCRRAVFYESPVSPIRREQAEARPHRPGQEWTTFIYDLTVLGTVEEDVLRYVREGRDLLKEVLSGEVSLDELTEGDE